MTEQSWGVPSGLSAINIEIYSELGSSYAHHFHLCTDALSEITPIHK
jgi:hypothetical protein